MADDARRVPLLQEPSLQASKAWLKKRSKAERWLLRGGVLLILAVLYAIGHYWLVDRFQEKTDNAYVRADISVVSAKVGGYVHAIKVKDNQHVKAGDVLLQLDSSDYEASLAQARANAARAQGELASMGAQRTLAAADLARYKPLAKSGILSPAGMQQIESRNAQYGASQAAMRAAVDAARAQVKTAQINLERTIVRAPVDGMIGDRQVQLGQLVQPGAPLMAVVPLDAVYVVANFKETQISDIRPGQPATIRPDIDHNLKLHGVVDSIAPASGAEFSIIPMDTATGNFTKIVQRVPVRIRIDDANAKKALLRPGLSANVMIDTRPIDAPARERPAS